MKKIVTVSGGTGGYTILSGLKNIKGISITALVSMADSGGSAGALQDELGVLPAGDVRQCLVALSEHTDVVRKLINYRFSEGPFSGHSFGNIFLAALEKVTGDFVAGVEIASEILKVKGKVVPITKDRAELVVKLTNGQIVDGEDKIDHTNIQKSPIEEISYKNGVKLNDHARVAIEEADYIVLGPGDFYTSIIPNLIVVGFKEALAKSKAKIILPINLTNKPGHTMYWSVGDYVDLVEDYLERTIDLILVNNKSPLKKQMKYYKEYYKLDNFDGIIVKDDLNDNRIIRLSLLSHLIPPPVEGDKIQNTRSFIRHDSKKLAIAIKKIIKK